MSAEPQMEALASVRPNSPRPSAIRGLVRRNWHAALVVALAVVLWLPRLSGPIDLRWDAGVYYLLGTSLAEGHGYRILSEPGAPEAIQYPPLLPAFVALHELALGTSDPAIVAPWLRHSYTLVFVAYALAIVILARRYLRRSFALIAAALAVLQMMGIFISDLLFAEIPFALVGVVFAIVAGNRSPASQPWLREAASFGLAVAGFLLRTAGIALLAAWVLEALVERRWRLMLARTALALLPIVAWQSYVFSVTRSKEYRQPAYAYQRAAYQYYNVSYAENILLIDSFRPELGRAGAGALAARLATNVVGIVPVFGEMISTKTGYWVQLLNRVQHHLLGTSVSPTLPVSLLMIGLALFVITGLVVLIVRREWIVSFIILTSIGLICTTPWPGQFTRYLVPLTPFLTICAMLGAVQLLRRLGQTSLNRLTIGGRIAVTGILLLIFAVQCYAALQIFRGRRSNEAKVVDPANGPSNTRLFFHDRSWQAWERAVDWIEQNSSPEAIVATSSPHLCYLRTGRRAVLPPMEADAARARQLLDAVPVSYVIVDELGFVDISRRYALPAMESDPADWQIVHSIGGTRIFAHASASPVASPKP